MDGEQIEGTLEQVQDRTVDALEQVEARVEELIEEVQQTNHLLNLILTIIGAQAGLDADAISDLAHKLGKLEVQP